MQSIETYQRKILAHTPDNTDFSRSFARWNPDDLVVANDTVIYVTTTIEFDDEFHYPLKTLDIKNPEDAQKYIDFAEVRGGQVIEDLKVDITWSEKGTFTCNLFTGHLGCGKSTELLRLKQELEQEQFHVVYFEKSVTGFEAFFSLFFV